MYRGTHFVRTLNGDFGVIWMHTSHKPNEIYKNVIINKVL